MPTVAFSSFDKPFYTHPIPSVNTLFLLVEWSNTNTTHARTHALVARRDPVA